MKKSILCAYLCLLACFLLLCVPGTPREPAPPAPAAESAAPSPGTAGFPAPETLRLLKPDGTVTEMDMQDYLVGVLAAEMPADFPEEALKAQAVAARTYALYCADGGKHGGADVCADPGCCQAW